MLTTFASAAALCAVLGTAFQQGPQAEPLWPNGAPGALGTKPEDVPTITIYRPAASQRSDAAVVVCPGGGYGGLAEHEGRPVAEWLNRCGITAAVLKYRLGPRYHHPVELGDASRAIRTMRARATELGLDPHKIGILGFSAGGHLASTAATHFDDGDPKAADPMDRVSSRPDAAILIYPVITMTDPFTHAGSRENLLGKNPAPGLVELLSNERQVTAKTPPTFLVSTFQDTVVPVENSLMFAEALRKAKVPFELHIFEQGEHGFGLGAKPTPNAEWPNLCANWLRARGWGKAN